jgi:AraC family transcriptional regulator
MTARFKGLEIELHRSTGVRVLRVVHPEEQGIDEHRHDWSYIGIHTAGEYLEQYDGGEALMAGPSAAFHPAGRPHADAISKRGLETLTVEFDPAWLKHHGFEHRIDRSRVWTSGGAAHAARVLASVLANVRTDAGIAEATNWFLCKALAAAQPVHFSWLAEVQGVLRREERLSTADLALRLDLHPGYLAHAYRYATGEGLHETARRSRVERASAMLRRTDLPLAEIALTAGFCDQSHMNRCFSAVLGRTPLRVREELRLFAEQAPGGVH